MNSQVQLLCGGRQLADWVRAGGRPERHATGYFHRIRWHAFWFEHNWRAQTQAIGASPLPDDPVFILGLWRSGTTALHELLVATDEWATPQTWQCFNPSTCFLTGPPTSDSSTSRPMDGGRISTNSPQEDEFAALLLGEPCLYRAFIDPRRLRECVEELLSSTGGERKRWQQFLRGVMLGATGRQLLLKSPNHSFRVPLLQKLFPRAKFVWIGRHTGEVLASNLRMWRAMTDRYALWGCPPTALQDFMQDMLSAYSSVLTQCLDQMPRESMLWVDFEELRTDTRQTIRRIWQFLRPNVSVGDESVASRLDQAVARVPIYAGSRTAALTGESAERLAKVTADVRYRFGALTR